MNHAKTPSPRIAIALLALLALLALSLAACQSTSPQATEAELRAEYARASAEWTARFQGQYEYNVRHIMVRTQAQAEAALARVRAGESFGAVANAVSLDEGSNRKGGELGWNFGVYFVPEFAAAMEALGPAGMTDPPVHTPFGWHVIEVTQRRTAMLPSFEQSRPSLEKLLRDRKTRR